MLFLMSIVFGGIFLFCVIVFPWNISTGAVAIFRYRPVKLLDAWLGVILLSVLMSCAWWVAIMNGADVFTTVRKWRPELGSALRNPVA